jgi:hypothetical protein
MHIVVYGSSKQGKTCLRRHCLKDDDYITVHCSNKMGLRELHTAILKAAGYKVSLSSKQSASGNNKVELSAKIPIVGVGAKATFEGGEEDEEISAELELDVEDVNDVIAALKRLNFQRFIVLEDFHYLPVETQKDFAVALKAFHENSKLSFIVVGVWLEENRLTVYNGDLTGRVVSVNADTWTRAELIEVVKAGEALLNISFDENFLESLLSLCQDSVHVVQEVCFEVCKRAKHHETKDVQITIGTGLSAEEIVKAVVNQQAGRYNSFLSQFADGFQQSALEMYRWLLYPILTAKIKDLEKGLRWTPINEAIKKRHPKGKELNPGNLTQALQNVANLQVKKDIKPIILDYDETNRRLNVVDRGFLIWLQLQDMNELLPMLGLPSNETSAKLPFDQCSPA